MLPSAARPMLLPHLWSRNGGIGVLSLHDLVLTPKVVNGSCWLVAGVCGSSSRHVLHLLLLWEGQKAIRDGQQQLFPPHSTLKPNRSCKSGSPVLWLMGNELSSQLYKRSTFVYYINRSFYKYQVVVRKSFFRVSSTFQGLGDVKSSSLFHSGVSPWNAFVPTKMDCSRNASCDPSHTTELLRKEEYCCSLCSWMFHASEEMGLHNISLISRKKTTETLDCGIDPAFWKVHDYEDTFILCWAWAIESYGVFTVLFLFSPPLPPEADTFCTAQDSKGVQAQQISRPWGEWSARWCKALKRWLSEVLAEATQLLSCKAG